jgi:LPXTG-motif cell wall-anchored protein
MGTRIRLVAVLIAALVVAMLVLPAMSFADDAITIEKSANPTHLDGPGNVTYTYRVTNTTATNPSWDESPTAIGNVGVVDDKLGTIAGPASGDNGNNQLDPGETWVYTTTVEITEDTTNTAAVEGLTESHEARVSATSGVVTVTVGAEAITPPAEEEVAGAIPTTGTPWYNVLVVGGALVLVGAAGLVTTARKRHA